MSLPSTSSSPLTAIPFSAQASNHTPVTAMITISLPSPTSASILAPTKTTKNHPQARTWSQILTLFCSQSTVTDLYWGTHLEQTHKIQLHIVRSTLASHRSFLTSRQYDEFVELVNQLCPAANPNANPTSSPSQSTSTTTSKPTITIRHAYLHNMTAESRALTTAPFTGTAIYVGIDHPQWDAAWALWSTIVPTWPGCLGVSGGYIIDEVEEGQGEGRAYIAWVGWETVETHDALHHDKFFRDRRIILTMGNKGYREYGHVVWHQVDGAAKANL